ncbi:MAG: aldo/keto reductase [Opitutales bacterium]|jgi:aryl-alcohol dehydrogenase-like predicted oxidoreductase
MNSKKLGNSDIAISALGMGCWAIGGPVFHGDKPIAYGQTDDAAATLAIHTALDLGITFFDTADMYGAGHSERVLGAALKGRRDKVAVATKFGVRFDEATKQATFEKDISPQFIRAACEASLKRLGTDVIDLYQYHVNDANLEDIDMVVETLEALTQEGKIRAYGHSTDFIDRATKFFQGPNCASMQYNCNLFDPAEEMVSFCETNGLTGINRGPLAMGLLTGKYTVGSSLGADDIRGKDSPEWMSFFKGGKPNPELLAKMDAVREILRSDGRTLAQGALAWLWAHSPVNVPICGIRNEKQARENAGALTFGPLSQPEFLQIESILRPAS